MNLDTCIFATKYINRGERDERETIKIYYVSHIHANHRYTYMDVSPAILMYLVSFREWRARWEKNQRNLLCISADTYKST